MEEIWKKIDDYEYEVSTLGNVRRIGSDKVLKPGICTGGYYQVSLYKNGKAKSKQIHRLVAIAFIPNPENKVCVDHIDNNRTNNHISNLRWCNISENNCNRAKNCKKNTSGFKGVCFDKQCNKYRARIKLNGKCIHLGYYKSAEEASEAYKNKAIELHKEFAKY